MMQLELLWRLQCIDNEITALKIRIKDKDTCSRLVEIKNKYGLVKDSLNKDVKELDDNNRRSARLNSDLEYLDEKVKENTQRIYSDGSSMKIINSLKNENENLKGKIDVTENELLALLDRHEILTFSIENSKKVQAELKQEFNKLKDAFKENSRNLGKELESLEMSRQSVLVKVDSKLLNKYNEIASKKSHPVSIVKDRVCTECGYQINTSLFDNVKKQKEIFECEYCGRILYIGE